MAEKSRVPWLSIVLTGLLAFVISMVVIAAVMADRCVPRTRRDRDCDALSAHGNEG